MNRIMAFARNILCRQNKREVVKGVRSLEVDTFTCPLEAKAAKTLSLIEQCGGYGFHIPKVTLEGVLNGSKPASILTPLSKAIGLKEESLIEVMRAHLQAGGSIFACLGLVDMYLAD